MSIPKVKPATYADLEALPPNVVGEIIGGVLYTHPRPAPRHVRAAGRLTSELDRPFDRGDGGPGGWIILTEPEIHFAPENILVPDVAGWRRERLPMLPNEAFIGTRLDWVCEVLSPSTQALDRTDKLATYAAFAVGHAWYVDPLSRTLEVFALRGGRWLLTNTFKNNDPVTAPPFEAHTFGLDGLWADSGA